MSKAIAGSTSKLLKLASAPIAPGPALLPVRPHDVGGGLVGDWLKMLDSVNGFYCFESALHVFPTRMSGANLGLKEWNEPSAWRHEYRHLDRGGLFVAEDIFGNQFCLLKDAIYTFDAETAQLEEFARSVGDWAHKVVEEFELVTGYPVGHRWQSTHGALAAGYRLAPKTPFVLGGPYEVENLYACEAIAAMRARGNLARQIADVPDGTPINFQVIG